LLSPHRTRLDSPLPNASVFLSGHRGPISRHGIRNYTPENPLRKSVPRSGMLPLGQHDPGSSGSPVAAAFHWLSRSIPGAPLPAGTFSASVIARSHPDIFLLRLHFLPPPCSLPTLFRLHVTIHILGPPAIPCYQPTMACRTPDKHVIAGVPGSSAYRFSRAAPNHPGESDGCFHPAASPPMAGFSRFDRLATLIRLTR